jgi:hypothetical protein
MKEAELAGWRLRVDESGEGTVGAPIRAVCMELRGVIYLEELTAIRYKV